MNPTSIVRHSVALGGALAAALLAGALFSSTPARADVQVRIDIGNAPPPPRFVFQARPRERYYATERVYVVDDPGFGDNDCFRYNGFYWVFSNGFWYRSSSWRRGFVVVQPRYVPAVFYRVPSSHWKHHPSGPPGLDRRDGGMPPGQMKKGGHDNGKHGKGGGH